MRTTLTTTSTRGIEKFSVKEYFLKILKVSYFHLRSSLNKTIWKLNILIEFYQSFQGLSPKTLVKPLRIFNLLIYLFIYLSGEDSKGCLAT